VVFVALNHTVLDAVELSWRRFAGAMAPGFASSLLVAALAVPLATLLRSETGWPGQVRLIGVACVTGLLYLLCVLLVPRLLLGAELLDFVGKKLPPKGLAAKLHALILRERIRSSTDK